MSERIQHVTRTVTRDQAIAIIRRQRPGVFYSVTFVKRTTGELRTMQCQNQVTAHLKGGDAAYDADAHGLIRVWSHDASGYRSIACEGIQELHAEGQRFVVAA